MRWIGTPQKKFRSCKPYRPIATVPDDRAGGSRDLGQPQTPLQSYLRPGRKTGFSYAHSVQTIDFNDEQSARTQI